MEEDTQLELKQLCETFSELGTMTAMKESLRAIYKISQNSNDAKIGFVDWCKKADKSKIPELITMARTLRKRMEGILAFWTCNRLTSAGMEGFNNKIRWLIRVAYGYRDDEYFNLKIFDLPNIKLGRDL